MTREEAIKIIDCYDIGFYDLSGEKIPAYKLADAFDMAIEALEQEPRKGHWIMSVDGLYRPICDKCGAHPWKGYIPTVEEATEVFKYCPNCGAEMVESQESEG